MSFPVHPPTIEWMALFGEQAPLKAPTGANERFFYLFGVIDNPCTLRWQCAPLQNTFLSLVWKKAGFGFSLWMRWVILREEYDDDGVINDHHVQRDNNHHFSVRRSLWRESSVCIFWVPAKHKWRTWKKVCHLQVPWLLSTCYIDRRHDLAWTGRISQLTLNHLSRPSSAGFQI